MEKFRLFSSRVVPLPLKDVDTDQIIPAQFLTTVSREGCAEGLFRRLRDADPKFPLNLPQYKDAKILLTDTNFGCGSSREHAVWALQGAGFRVLIGKSFADIFTGNSAKNGLLLIQLADAIVDELTKDASSGPLELSIDLLGQEIGTADGKSISFEYDSFRKYCLLEGLDDVDYILSHQEAIEQFRTQQSAHRYFSTLNKAP